MWCNLIEWGYTLFICEESSNEDETVMFQVDVIYEPNRIAKYYTNGLFMRILGIFKKWTEKRVLKS